MAERTEGPAAVNRPPEPTEQLPTTPYPRAALAACAAPPVAALLIGPLARTFDVFAIELPNSAVLPMGYVVFLVVLFPLFMPPDVRHLASLVSAGLLAPLAVVWLLWSAPVGVYLLPVVGLSLIAWAVDHPGLLGRTQHAVAPGDG